MMFTCTKCGVEKDRDAFYRNSRKRNGLQSWCKVCKTAHKQATYDRDKRRAYRAAHALEIRAHQQAYRRNNVEEERARKKRWLTANPDKAEAIKRRRDAKSRCSEYLERRRLRAKTIRDAAGPEYAAGLLRMKQSAAPPQLLEMKRDQLILRRMALQLKKAIHESITNTR